MMLGPGYSKCKTDVCKGAKATLRCGERRSMVRMNLKTRMVDSTAGELVDRANAHGVGLLQEPFGTKGEKGAFPCLPSHVSGDTGPRLLDPWGGKGFPEGCTEDPFGLVKDEIYPFADSIKAVLSTDHPVLEKVFAFICVFGSGRIISLALVIIHSLKNHICVS
jgi:hypothetical protein